MKQRASPPNHTSFLQMFAWTNSWRVRGLQMSTWTHQYGFLMVSPEVGGGKRTKAIGSNQDRHISGATFTEENWWSWRQGWGWGWGWGMWQWWKWGKRWWGLWHVYPWVYLCMQTNPPKWKPCRAREKPENCRQQLFDPLPVGSSKVHQETCNWLKPSPF